MAGHDNRVQLRLDADLAGWLRARQERTLIGSIHEQARAELAAWRLVQEHALRTLPLSLEEWNCVADVMQGTMLTMGLGKLAFSEAHDAFAIARDRGGETYGEKWGIDEARLLERLASLDPVADLALRDAVASWWEDRGSEPTAAGWAGVGACLPGQG